MSFGVGVGDFLAVLKLAQSVRGRWIDAPPEYASIKNEIKNVENLLRDISDLETRVELTPQEAQSLQDATSSCTPVLETCNEIVGKYVSITHVEPGSRSRVRRSWKRLKLDPDDIRHARDRLSSVVSQLAAIEGAIQVRVTTDTHDAVNDLQQSDDQREREKIADWYAPASFAVQQHEYSRGRQSGTGAWFLRDDRYTRWRDKDNTSSHSTLFCPGIPGSGKTMMATAVIEDLRMFLDNEDGCVVVYFYCNFRRSEQQELHHMFSSFVRQLFQEQLTMPREVQDLYSKHRDRQTRPSVDELRVLLRLLAQQHRTAYFVIDALDECNISGQTRDRLLNELFDIQNGPGNVRLFATTRLSPEVMQRFTACEQIEIRAVPEDIERYLDNRMGELASFVRRRDDLRKEIKSQIIALVDGMFLLAKLHFEALIGYTNPTKLRGALQSLPSGEDALVQAYDTARERIDHQPRPQAELAHQVLTWIAYSKRELSIGELQEAVAISMSPGKSDLDHQNDLDEPDLMVSVCAGLVVLDSDTNVIRLVHFTTQSYIESVQHVWLPDVQVNIARCCVEYFRLKAFSHEYLVKDIDFEGYFQIFKLLSYVVDYWGDHVRETNEAHIQDRILPFLRDKPLMHFLGQALKHTTRPASSFLYLRETEDVSSLHVCALFDLEAACRGLLMTEEVCDLKDNLGRTPLFYAVAANSLNALRLLMSQPDVDVNARNNFGISILNVAVQYGRQAAVSALLSHPSIDVNAKTEKIPPALFIAARSGKREVVDELLRHPRINVNLSHRGCTAIAVAMERKQVDVFDMLLSHPDIDVNGTDDYERSLLLMLASCNARDRMELYLHQPGIDINARDCNGHTALYRAAGYNFHEIVQLLLDQPGIDVNARDKYGYTALMHAAIRDHPEIVGLLLDHPSIDVNASNNDGCTALYLATLSGRTEVVKTLLRQPGIHVPGDPNELTACAGALFPVRKEILTLLQPFYFNGEDL